MYSDKVLTNVKINDVESEGALGIATKQRPQSKADRDFMEGEVKHLIAGGKVR